MPDERSETPRGAPGGGDPAAEVTPGQDPSGDEDAAPDPDVTDVPIGIPGTPEDWRDLKRRADDPDDTTPDQPNDHSE